MRLFACVLVGALLTAQPATLTESALSVLEQNGAQCEWLRLDPVAATRIVVATFSHSCLGGRIALSPGHHRAIVWFDPSLRHSSGYYGGGASKPKHTDDPPDQSVSHVYEVSFPDGRITAVPFPKGRERAQFEEIAYTASGELAAFAVEELSEQEGKSGRVVVDGEVVTFKLPSEGLPALAHAYRLMGTEWKRFETKFTTTGWDYGAGFRTLNAVENLGFRSIETLRSHVDGETPDAVTLTKLQTLQPKGRGVDDGEWTRVSTGAGPIYVWMVRGEFTHTTGLIAVATGDQVEPLPNLAFSDGEIVSVQVSGSLLLIAGSHAGAYPQLYDLNKRAVIWSSQTARATTFWPRGLSALK